MADRRGKRYLPGLEPLTVERILEWADQERARTGEWPISTSGPISGTDGNTWRSVQNSLVRGRRGLPGGTTLSKLLMTHRGARGTIHNRITLSVPQILKWADLFRARTGGWPQIKSGPVDEVSGLTWKQIQLALNKGLRGLPGGSSLARLLAEQRDLRIHYHLPPLSLAKILEWADDHLARTGRWPTAKSGVVLASPEEKWSRIDGSLQKGNRGLPGGSSLAQLLKAHCRSASTP